MLGRNTRKVRPRQIRLWLLEPSSFEWQTVERLAAIVCTFELYIDGYGDYHSSWCVGA